MTKIREIVQPGPQDPRPRDEFGYPRGHIHRIHRTWKAPLVNNSSLRWEQNKRARQDAREYFLLVPMKRRNRINASVEHIKRPLVPRKTS